MKEDRGGILAILIVLLGGLMVIPGGAGRSGQSQVPKQGGGSEAAQLYDACGKDVISAVRTLLGQRPATESTQPAPPAAVGESSTGGETANRLQQVLADLKQGSWDSMYPAEMLIATVPDPIDSTVGWRFDERVAAVKQAAEDTGHVFDQFWLPWRCKDPAVGVHEMVPGILTFRGAYHTLVVLLVGETPSAGVHAEALRASLDLVEAWQKTDVNCTSWTGRADSFKQLVSKADGEFKCPRLDRRVNIVGPTFSGSISSMRQVLVDWRKANGDPPEVRIVSGSATNDTLRDLLLRGTDPAFERDVTLKTTIIPDTFLVTALDVYLRDEIKVRPGAVAILVESGTTYGQLFKGELKRRRKEEGRWRILPFPLHIAQIRQAAVSKHRKGDDLPEALTEDHSILAIGQGEAQSARDVLPAMMPAVSGASEELALANILSAIAREGFSYVGLFATDVRDKLFLAERIKKYAPGVTLFTFESDLLYAHPDYNAALEGTLVVSTYPLFTPNQQWTQSKDRAAIWREMLQFASDGAEGTYNATLAQLNRMREDLIHLSHESSRSGELTRPRSVAPLLEYSMPFSPGSVYPPVFVSAVGRRGSWPLRAYSFDQIVCERKKRTCERNREEVRECEGGAAQTTPCQGARRVVATCPEPTTQSCRSLAKVEGSPWTKIDDKLLLTGPFGAGYREFEEDDGPPETSRNLGSAWAAFTGLLAFALVLIIVYLRPLPSRYRRLHAWDPFEPRQCGVCRHRQWGLLWGLFATLSMTLILFFRPYPHFLSGLQLGVCGLLLFVTTLVPTRIAYSMWRDDGADRSAGACGHQRTPSRLWPLGKWLVVVMQVLLIVAVFSIAHDLYDLDRPDQAFLLHRAGYLGGGLSPLAPLVFLASGFLWCLFLNLRRLVLIESSLPPTPAREAVSGPLYRLFQSVRRALQSPFRSARPAMMVAALLLTTGPFFVVVLFQIQPIFEFGFLIPPIEPIFGGITLGYHLVVLLIFTYYFVLAISLLHLLFLWRRARRLPSFFEARWPRRAFTRIAGKLPSDMVRGLWARPMKVSDLESFINLARDAARSSAGLLGCTVGQAAERDDDVGIVAQSARAAARAFPGDIARATQTNQWTFFATTRTQQELSRATLAASKLLEELETGDTNGTDGAVIKWIASLEDLVASQYVVFLAPCFLYMRHLATFLVGASLLFLLAMTSYPVQPAGLLLLQGFAWLMASVGAALFAILQLRRDRVLRELEGPSEERQGFFDPKLVTTLGTYVVLPALGLLATTSPEFARVLEQVLRIFR